MKDPAHEFRKKTRFVVEYRYDALPQFMDVRGRIIGSIYPHIETRFKRWRSNDEQIVFLDNAESPRTELLFGMKRSLLVMEDPGSLQEFVDLFHKIFPMAYDHIGEWLTTVKRVGVRFIEVLASTQPDYESTLKYAIETFHKTPFDLPLDYSDSQTVLVHKYGRIAIGPTRPGDEWLELTFKHPSTLKVHGFAVDIDSYATDVDVHSKADFTQAFAGALKLTTASEESLLSTLGLNRG